MLQLTSKAFGKEKIDTLVLPVSEDKPIHADRVLSEAAAHAGRFKEFGAKTDEQLVLYDLPGVKAKRVIFIGVGKTEDLNAETMRAAAGKAVKKCMDMGLSETIIAVPAPEMISLDITMLLESLMEGACLANHLFDKYKKEKKRRPLKKIFFQVSPEVKRKYTRVIGRTEAVCQGTILAREWVSMPPNEKRPEQFARLIAARAGKAALSARVLDEKMLKQKKFGALLAVAAGSLSRPRLVILDYHPKQAVKTVVFVGKGVTFDSGGINLKPSASLEDMKSDMSGAAAVAASLIAIARLKPAVRVVGVLPIVENMPSGNATRPGDIVTSLCGKTVEIGNTDAEGRLILIDAMAYAVRQYRPQVMIDLATLTGACMVALGDRIAGVFSADDELAESIVACGEKTHERCWRMPLPGDYKALLKSEFADISNMSTSRWGGAITAALFLSEFVEETRWAHIDIAGPAYAKKANAYCDAGGTGFGVRLLCELLDRL